MRLIQVVLLLVCFFSTQCAAGLDSTKVIGSYNNQLTQDKAKLELIAKYMGRDFTVFQPFNVKNVSLRQLLFQSNELYKKLNVLYFEITGFEYKVAELSIKQGEVTKADLAFSLNKISEIIDSIIKFLSIESDLEVIDKKTSSASLSTLFYRLRALNQISNQLLERDAQPSEVFQNVTLAVYYSGEILKSMSGEDLSIQQIELSKNKYPKDVFKLLMKVLEKLLIIARQLDIDTLEISRIKNLDNLKITPNEVKELSLFILVELEIVCAQKGIQIDNILSIYPGKKYPSDVYRRGEMLDKQIDKILRYVKSHPEWQEQVEGNYE